MTELKTLKDMKPFERIGSNEMINIEELKAEAIKDIKEFWRGHLPKELWGLTKENKEGIQAYIKWKMNLTEEDIK
jgi:hypothetical protein